jgi:hypothetical protein
MISARTEVTLAAALWLGACASGPKPAPEAWTGGVPARLAADQSACRAEVANLDVNVASNYSDPRYGVTSAMAEAVAKADPMADRDAIVRRAAYDTCMNDKGWRAPQ